MRTKTLADFQINISAPLKVVKISAPLKVVKT